MKESLTDLLAGKTKNNPAAIHIDFIGLIRMGKDNAGRLEEFCNLLKETESKGGNICIPAYSLSYTKNEDYNILETPSSNIGIVSEYVRQNSSALRTVDALFSYITFGKNISRDHFEVKNYESFGNDSLVGELFEKDGYICSIGGIFRNSTEIHFIEKLLEVKYRSDKKFEGNIIDTDGKIHRQQITFFCKNFDFNLWYNFKKLEDSLKKDGLMEVFKVEGYPFYIEGIKFRTLYEYVEIEIRKDYKYFLNDLKDKRKGEV